MVRLNKAQFVTCWVVLWVISVFVLAPAIEANKRYRYEAKDGWYMNGFYSRSGELVDKEGRHYRISQKSEKRYYYAGTYNKYSLIRSKHPYERIILIVILNGVFLIYTLGRKKPTKTSKD